MKDPAELSPLGQHLRKYRRVNRWSLAAFAAEHGFSKSFMWELENGVKNNPSLDTMMKLAVATETTLARIATLAAAALQEHAQDDPLDALRPEVRGRGPCKVCGATGYALSYGGPDICPACDCGIKPDVSRLTRELANARAELVRLAGAERQFDEVCSLWTRDKTAAVRYLDRAEKAEAELAALKARIANSCRADGQRVFDLLGLPIEFDGVLALVKVEE